MNIMLQDRFMRRPDVRAAVGFSDTSLDTAVSSGTFPPPIKLLGARAVGWVSSEVDAVIQARIAGRNNDEVRALVASIVAKRGRK